MTLQLKISSGVLLCTLIMLAIKSGFASVMGFMFAVLLFGFTLAIEKRDQDKFEELQKEIQKLKDVEIKELRNRIEGLGVLKGFNR